MGFSDVGEVLGKGWCSAKAQGQIQLLAVYRWPVYNELQVPCKAVYSNNNGNNEVATSMNIELGLRGRAQSDVEKGKKVTSSCMICWATTTCENNTNIQQGRNDDLHDLKIDVGY